MDAELLCALLHQLFVAVDHLLLGHAVLGIAGLVHDLKADGEKQAAITAAEGEKEAAILRADAVKQQRILEAEGEAQAILAVQKANADAIRLLNEAMPSDKVLAIRSLEALAKVANGKATKIIIPSELQNLGGVVPSIKELMTDPKDAE